MIVKRFTIILLGITTCLASLATPAVLKAHLDSATLLMGRVTVLHIDLVRDKGTTGRLNIDAVDTLTREVEVAARLDGDTSDIGNGREQIRRDIVLQSFDSGLYVLPPVAYIVGTDTTFAPDRLSLKVIPVNVDSLDNVHPLKPVAEPEYKWYDALPMWLVNYWWVILPLAALCVVIALAVYMKRKHGAFIPHVARKRLPPADEALQALHLLKRRGLWQQGQDKQYFTELTDILRVYIDRRYGINAVEMTTTEIKRTLREHGETRAVDDHLNMILEIADWVKFAGQRAMPADNESAWQRAVDFVEATRPQPEPVNAAEGKHA